MDPRRALAALAALALLALAHANTDVILDLTDEQYYEMPQLFALDEWAGCRAARGVYCVGSFELSPERHPHALFDVMQRYSANWVDNFNHTRLHRGLCLPRSCAPHAPAAPRPQHYATWFSTCVNASMSAAYNLSAQLTRLEYCAGAGAGDDVTPLTSNERAFAWFVSALLALAALCTALDLTLSDHAKKGAEWALAWSVPACWRALHAPPPRSARTDLASFDGLRVLTMLVVIIEHVCWITTHTYLTDTRIYEEIRSGIDVVLMTNSTLVVQIFFIMSSFLLAHKLLQQRRRGENVPPVATFVSTMINRIIRLSPSYWVVVWFAASWWERMGRGPMWAPLVASEAAVCRRKWWTHLLYLNNILYADDKCLIQTWYLAADLQLYALCLLLTLLLWRWRRAALLVLGGLLLAALALLFTLAYSWHLVPTLVMHSPESVRVSYNGDMSFNLLYQSPLGNLPGALAGLLLAHLHHALLDNDVQLPRYKVFSCVSVWSVLLAAGWVCVSPRALGRGPPSRLPAAALAALERPVFSLFTCIALLGAINGVPSWVRRCLSWRGWSCWARLSFGALLLHMPINKSLVAARLMTSQLDRQTAIAEWFGVAAVSYLAALPLALLVELPAQRLTRALWGGGDTKIRNLLD
ncbi:O-acyltransferase like protein-like [Trichoplusia ni]|uniref:O-acyltransferase like protein-like n=1 Tax=Trichoplusia ni TaxID=7111 RepID=A0A7E5WAD8_TRINI|nr:O-acyltransferase like protein-like [Trichoplusia ni]